jgi:hypothetical protein
MPGVPGLDMNFLIVESLRNHYIAKYHEMNYTVLNTNSDASVAGLQKAV